MSAVTEHINYPKVVWEAQRRFRIARTPLLQALDIEFMRALETNDTGKISEVVAKKTALRNITEYDFSTVANVDDVLDIWPDILGDKPEF